MVRWTSMGLKCVAVVGFLFCIAVPAGGLQPGGPVCIMRPNKKARPHPRSNSRRPPLPTGKGGEGGGEKASKPPPSILFEPLNTLKFSGMPAGGGAGGAGGGGRKAGGRKKRGCAVVGSKSKRRLQSKVRQAGRVPDLSKMLRDGLPYLTRNEGTEVQLALAVSVYAHSKSRHEQHDHSVKAGVEVCLQLGRLGMGTDALLAAILSGVLRPGTSSQKNLGFGRAPVTLEEIREGFGPKVARLLAGLEHVTCVEETAYRILRERQGGPPENVEREDLSLAQSMGPGKGKGVSGETAGDGGTPDGASGGAGKLGGVAPGGDGGGRKGNGRSSTEASALEQGEKLRNLIVSEAADWQVLMLWLAVHLEALQRSLQGDGSKDKVSEQLARDALLVHGPLAHRLGVHQLRNELESAAFRRLFPEQFQEVRRATQDRSVVYETLLEATKKTLKEAVGGAVGLANELEDEVVLQHRIKSPYSMWKKMEKKMIKVEGVYDAVAIRVVLNPRRWQGESDESYTARSEDRCYQAMSVIQNLYPSVERRLKDYIAKPKPNGYQSLHATQLVPDLTSNGPPVVIEFQVRSKEMHKKAEFGLAAHWCYKGSGMSSGLDWISSDPSTPSATDSSTVPAKAVVPDSVTSGRELVDWLHQELQQRKVFVFGPDRRIWELDKSEATAADVLGRSYMKSFYEGSVPYGRLKHSRTGAGAGDAGTTAWVNGQEVEPSYRLKNGDVFDVRGATRKKPLKKLTYAKRPLEIVSKRSKQRRELEVASNSSSSSSSSQTRK